jgi:DNA-binding transcriptional LysR family regulator
MADDFRFLRNLDWNLLKTFNEIVRAGNLTQAALGLSRKQPAVSLALQRLEDQLGIKLCDRSANRFELTAEGHLVADMCQSMAESIRDMPFRIANIDREVRGQIRIAMISSIVSTHLDHTIRRFHGLYPDVKLDIDIGSWEEVGNLLLRQQVDIGIAAARFTHAELTYTPFIREAHRLYCGESHHLYGTVVDNPKGLVEEAFVLTGADEADVITRYRLEHGLGKVVSGVSEYLDEVKRMAIQGVGLCFLPEEFVRAEVDRGQLWPLMPENAVHFLELFVITRTAAPVQLPGRLFLDELERELG